MSREFKLSRREVIEEMVRQGWHHMGWFAFRRRVKMYMTWQATV
jgi:hypothetical protein